MTEDRNEKPSATEQQTLDPRLKDQIETSLDGAYRVNATTANYGIVWVWLAYAIEFGAASIAVVSLVLGTILLTGTDVRIGEDLVFFDYQWTNSIVAFAAASVLWWFMRSIRRSVHSAEKTAKEMANRYTNK